MTSDIYPTHLSARQWYLLSTQRPLLGQWSLLSTLDIYQGNDLCCLPETPDQGSSHIHCLPETPDQGKSHPTVYLRHQTRGSHIHHLPETLNQGKPHPLSTWDHVPGEATSVYLRHHTRKSDRFNSNMQQMAPPSNGGGHRKKSSVFSSLYACITLSLSLTYPLQRLFIMHVPVMKHRLKQTPACTEFFSNNERLQQDLSERQQCKVWPKAVNTSHMKCEELLHGMDYKSWKSQCTNDSDVKQKTQEQHECGATDAE